MKVGPFILLLFHLHNVLSDHYNKSPKTSYPKKFPRKIAQISISRKLFKPVSVKTTKIPYDDKTYTVFAPIGTAEKKIYNVPDSPIFGINPHEQKTRVKKVLPEYGLSAIRKKRSVSGKRRDDTASETTGSSKVTVGRSKVSEGSKNNSLSRRNKARKSKQGRKKSKTTKRNKNKKRNRKPRQRSLNRTNTKKSVKRQSQKGTGNNNKPLKKIKRSRNEGENKAVSKKGS